MAKPDTKIPVSDLHYYFDAKRKDSKDKHSASDRSRKVLDLRDRLLTLSDTEFELALKTLNGLLDQTKGNSKESKDSKSETRDAISLYEKAQAHEPAPVGKVNPI